MSSIPCSLSCKILTVKSFDELGVRKDLTSKNLTNCISLTCKQLLKENFEQ